jgi:hypothetical protein
MAVISISTSPSHPHHKGREGSRLTKLSNRTRMARKGMTEAQRGSRPFISLVRLAVTYPNITQDQQDQPPTHGNDTHPLTPAKCQAAKRIRSSRHYCCVLCASLPQTHEHERKEDGHKESKELISIASSTRQPVPPSLSFVPSTEYFRIQIGKTDCVFSRKTHPKKCSHATLPSDSPRLPLLSPYPPTHHPS